MNIIKRLFIQPFYFMGLVWVYSLPTAIAALIMAGVDSKAVLLAIENIMPWEHPLLIYGEFKVMKFTIELIYGVIMLILGMKGMALDLRNRGPITAMVITRRR